MLHPRLCLLFEIPNDVRRIIGVNTEKAKHWSTVVIIVSLRVKPPHIPVNDGTDDAFILTLCVVEAAGLCQYPYLLSHCVNVRSKGYLSLVAPVSFGRFAGWIIIIETRAKGGLVNGGSQSNLNYVIPASKILYKFLQTSDEHQVIDLKQTS
eukprot:Blabericola_migrator_1__6633@NODE_3347_length_1839_cov_772_893341_g749_i2_p2_GENE_NODE_3347_length_1839_cov_772_893341_g749_i2NODE_3347_length_1839_cov_772_893341_g749_i2_p2_ORF_typecomplete_len152_score16_18_NODE_3347_length_1839_cov_772_893341_g749_i227482